MPRQREQHGQKPSIKRTWRHEVLKKAHGGWDGALELGSRGFSRDAPPRAADRVQEGHLYLRVIAKGLMQPVVCG